MPERPANFTLSVVASVAFLALTVLAASRGRRDPLARLLAFVCLDLFVYGTFEAISELTTQRLWDWLNNATASLAPALFYHFVCSFVGRRVALRVPVGVAYVYFGTASLFCLSPLAIARADPLSGGSGWAIAMLVGMLVVVVHGIALVVRHMRGAAVEEVARSRLVLGAVVIPGLANMVELMAVAGATWSPHLGMMGLVVSVLFLAAAALRVRLLERLSFLTAVNAVAIAVAVVLSEIAVFQFAGDRTALAVVFTVLVVVGALVATRFVVRDYATARERTLAHATLGRMAAQMAHDIKNPLASIRGAAQFLAQERATGRSIDDQNEFLELLVAQCDRLTRIVDQYHRIGRGEPVLGSTDLNDAVREAMRFLGTTAELDAALDDAIPKAETDRDLLVIALENVLRNAHEAATGRAIHITTGRVARPVASDERAWLYIAVRDEGAGMDPRTRERALEGFFTTKSQGSGLGLAFVRRVVEAHGGKLLIDSQEGRGTTVRIELRAA
jgi:two-component system sensor histidine kinase HydH